jgi:hypothetical protein
LNAAPNSGPAGFTTSFTDQTTPGGFTISNLDENNLMVGQALFEPTVTDALHMVFSAPVTALSVDFAIDILPTSAAGTLTLTTSSGVVNQASSVVGGSFQGGHLTFSTATPFTSADLQGILATGAPTQIEIDNLTLTLASVPEPASLTLLATGTIGLLGSAWRRRKSAAA